MLYFTLLKIKAIICTFFTNLVCNLLVLIIFKRDQTVYLYYCSYIVGRVQHSVAH